ncbi:MAG: hypothetical protein KF887_08490 [Paracoccaceae bacterium]|nr:MAG: hypothetical protein KF887_08490 [Paracoccaceae bacterium]
MAHSYVSFGPRSAHMHDAEIIVTLAWLRHTAEADPARFPEVDHPYLSAWRGMAEVYMPGCLDPELDETLTTPEAVDRFAALARAARAALEAAPEVISGDRLNAMTGMAEFLEFQDRPRSRMLADLDRLVGVVVPA